MMWQAVPARLIPANVINTRVEPRLLSKTASYDVVEYLPGPTSGSMGGGGSRKFAPVCLCGIPEFRVQCLAAATAGCTDPSNATVLLAPASCAEAAGPHTRFIPFLLVNRPYTWSSVSCQVATDYAVQSPYQMGTFAPCPFSLSLLVDSRKSSRVAQPLNLSVSERCTFLFPTSRVIRPSTSRK
jgi:hypothetical protein